MGDTTHKESYCSIIGLERSGIYMRFEYFSIKIIFFLILGQIGQIQGNLPSRMCTRVHTASLHSVFIEFRFSLLLKIVMTFHQKHVFVDKIKIGDNIKLMLL